MDIIRGSLAAVLAVGLVGCASTQSIKPDFALEERLSLGGIQFSQSNNAKACIPDALCYEAEDSVFISMWKDDNVINSIQVIGDDLIHVFQYWIEDFGIEKTGSWNNRTGFMSSENGYRAEIEYVNLPKSTPSLFIAAYCKPEKQIPCNPQALSDVIRETKKVVLKEVKTTAL